MGRFWNVVDKHKFKSNWHIDCIADHLEAVADGDITRLVINIPPRHCKSLLCSVFFPTWLWLEKPQTQFLSASYAQSLSTRDCLKSRRIIQTADYQSLIPVDASGHKEWGLTKDQNQKTRYENTETGHRIAISVDGALTGEGGDIIIVDDPHNVRDTESKAKRQSAIEWWDEALQSRLNDSKTGVFIVIQQRVHEVDLTGHIMEKEKDQAKAEGYEFICLPARYEKENRIKTSITDWTDLRTEDGEPLWKSHLDEAALNRLESGLSEYAIAGQYQQRPAPRAGGMFKGKNFRYVEKIDRADVVQSVRYWDKAGTQDGGCFTAGVLMHLMKDHSYVIEDVTKGQWSASLREKNMETCLDRDLARCGAKRLSTWIEQEPGSSGKEAVDATIKNLAPHKVKADRVSGDKETRAEGLATQTEIQNVFLLKGDWNKDFIEELKKFPRGKFKDQVDAASGAFHKLHAPKKRAGALQSTRDKEKASRVANSRKKLVRRMKSRRRV